MEAGSEKLGKLENLFRKSNIKIRRVLKKKRQGGGREGNCEGNNSRKCLRNIEPEISD